MIQIQNSKIGSKYLFHLYFQRFNEAAERVKTLTKRPTDQELLQLYAFFKQGSFGDNNTSKSPSNIILLL